MHEQSRLKQRYALNENWIVALLALAALVTAMIMDSRGLPQKWHAAILWTVTTFGALVLLLRRKWALIPFWGALAICFLMHLLLMWVIFSQLLAESKKVGMLYAVPFAFIETLFLQLLLPALERQLFGVSKKESH